MAWRSNKEKDVFNLVLWHELTIIEYSISMNQTISSQNTLFPSFFIGGFECSTHRLRNGRRLDLTAGTQHDRFANEDYRRLRKAGILTARDGFRWHLIEATPGKYDFSSAIPIIRAARENGVKVIWDLLHFGWPDHVDVLAPDFVERFSNYVREVGRVLESEGEHAPYIAPVNEPSFLAWAGGDAAFFNPFKRRHGNKLKYQFVRAAIAATKTMREIHPQTRVFHIDPMINVAPMLSRPQDRAKAERFRQYAFDFWDMICGRLKPELGGHPDYLDVIGVNYYSNNQRIYDGATLEPSNPQYVPLRYLLNEVWERYQRPLFIAETGTEDEARPSWLRYIGQESRAARALGVALEGVCLYPIVNHPGWDDDRHCHNGLWDYAQENGHREAYEPLARELNHQQELMAQEATAPDEEVDVRLLDTAAIAMEEANAHVRPEIEV